MYVIKTEYWEQRGLTLQEKVVMNELSETSEIGEWQHIKNDHELTEILGVHDRTFSKVLDALQAKKFIERDYRNGYHARRFIKRLK